MATLLAVRTTIVFLTVIGVDKTLKMWKRTIEIAALYIFNGRQKGYSKVSDVGYTGFRGIINMSGIHSSVLDKGETLP